MPPRPRSFRFFLLASLATCSAALAAPLPRSAGVRIGPAGLATLSEVVRTVVPNQLPLDPLRADLLSCPGGSSIALDVSNATVGLQLHEASVRPIDGALELGVSLDLQGSAHVALERGLACLGTIACDVSFVAKQAAVSAAIELAIVEGQVSAGVRSLLLDLRPEDFQLTFSGCALESLSQELIDLVTQTLIKHNRGTVEAMLAPKLPPVIEQQVATMLGRSGEIASYRYQAQLHALSISPAGIDGYLALGLDYTGEPAACLPEGAVSLPSGAAAPALAEGDVAMAEGPVSPMSLGVSGRLVSDGLLAAWRSGLMCMDAAKIAALGLDPSGLAALVPGLPEGTRMALSANLATPPRITTGADGALAVRVEGAAMGITLEAPGAAPAQITISTDFVLRVRAAVDAATGMITAELADLEMDRMELTAGEDGATAYAFDPARLEVVLKDVLLPLLDERLGRVPLAPAAFGRDGVFVYLDGIRTTAEGLYVGLGAFVRPASDDGLPITTASVAPGRYVRPGALPLALTGHDDLTPSPLVRYRWQLDGGTWSEPALGGAPRISVTAPGAHRLLVRAVDQNDNEERDPRSFSFEVDAVPPRLELAGVPSTVLTSTSLVLDLAAHDNLTEPGELRYAYRLEEALPGEPARLLRKLDRTRLVNGVRRIQVEDLAEGGVYKLTLLVYDEAGNVSSETLGFGVTAGTGCTLGLRQPAGHGAGALLLVLLILGLSTRRSLRLQLARAWPRR